MLEARAINRYIGSSPRKMRLVIDLIRGKSVDKAIAILHFTPNHGAKIAEKVLRSAVSNLHNKDEGSRIETHEMIVKEVFVNCGPSMKRVLPAPMGRAFRIQKRSNHLTIVIAQKAQKTAKAATPAAPKPKERDKVKEVKNVKKEK